jgi:hypothetical protein
MKKSYGLGDLGVDGRKILKWILKNYNARVRTRIHLVQERDIFWSAE